MKVAVIPLFFAIPDLARAYVRLPLTGGVYGSETVLMALNGFTGVIAFVATITKRKWAFAALCVWLVVGTIRLLTVGNLR